MKERERSRQKSRHQADTASEEYDSSQQDTEPEAEMHEVQHDESRQPVLDAEKYKAVVECPKGNIGSFDLSELKRWVSMNEDDKFFHLTCQVDHALREKIENGAFVDLNKLLPKMRFQSLGEEQHMHFVNKNGESYLVPSENEQKINGIRRWEQAFRIYAAIFWKKHPHRSWEIWQYVHVINTVASSYSWENVAYYDFTFRHLMDEHPERSWSKVYQQLWSLAMCEPLQKSNQAGNCRDNMGGGHRESNSKDSSKKNWHERCCWRFNRGSPCQKWNCNFDHRCKYCGSWNHASIDGPKRTNKSDARKSDGSSPSGGKNKHNKNKM